VVAVWRRLGAETGLPMVVIQEDGAVSSMGQQVGRSKAAAVGHQGLVAIDQGA
jgi:hypothetical protein